MLNTLLSWKDHDRSRPKEVGEAYNFLLEIRLDEGELGEEAAKRRLLEWWQAR